MPKILDIFQLKLSEPSWISSYVAEPSRALPPHFLSWNRADSMFIRGYRIFWTSRYQGIVKSTVTGLFQDLMFKILEGYKQNWSCPGSALLCLSRAEPGQVQFWSDPSEIFNLRSWNTPETVDFTIPWYQTNCTSMRSKVLAHNNNLCI